MEKKVALISDLHFGIKKNSDVYFESQKKYLVNQLIPYLKENNISKIFFLGDMFDNRNSINTKIQNEVYNLFDKSFKDFDIKILVGNHDTYFTNTTEINSVKFLDKFHNIEIIEQPKIIEIYNKKILLSPWIVNFCDFINYISDKNFDISFGHYNIKGFHYNKNKISEDGLDASLFENKCKKIFSGHFHIRSKQTFKNCEIIYIGSPYQLNRNDIDEERGSVILNLDDLSYEFLNNNVSIKFIKIYFPQKIKKEIIENNIVDVHVKYDENYNEESIEKYLQQITKFNPAFPPQIIMEVNTTLDKNFNINTLNSSSIQDLMQEYLNTIDIKNKDEIYGILIDLYNTIK